MITLLVYHLISPCDILKWHITFPIVSHKSNHLIIAISIYAWLTQFDRGIDLGCSLLGRAKNRTWSYLRIYIYYCMLQMKKNTSKKCSLKCILSVVSSHNHACSIFTAYFHTLPAKIHTWWTGSVIADM